MKKTKQDTQRSQRIPSKRLSLPRETIRILARGDLDLVAGGAPITETTTPAGVKSPC